MSIETRRYNMPKLTPKMLGVYHCGITKNHPNHSARSLLSEYSAHFILSGKGKCIIQGNEFEVCEGQGFMLQPFIPCTYIGDGEAPWTYIYANFNGAGDAALAKAIGIDSTHHIFEFDEKARESIIGMFDSAENEPNDGLLVTSYFLRAMSLIAGNVKNAVKSHISEDEYVNKALDYIMHNYPYSIRISDIADNVGIERSYFHKVFKNTVGMTPERYLTQFRLEKAEELMHNTDPSVTLTDIALGSGFYDLSHFSRVFFEKHGCSPSRYNKSIKAEDRH